jgi:hypothetical protein
MKRHGMRNWLGSYPYVNEKIPLTDQMLPIITAAAPAPTLISRKPRGAVIVANVLVAVMGLLGIPVSMVGAMNLGMEGAYRDAYKGWRLLWFDLSLAIGYVTIVCFPVVCVVSLMASIYLGSRGRDGGAVAVALLPPLGCIACWAVMSAFGS